MAEDTIPESKPSSGHISRRRFLTAVAVTAAAALAGSTGIRGEKPPQGGVKGDELKEAVTYPDGLAEQILGLPSSTPENRVKVVRELVSPDIMRALIDNGSFEEFSINERLEGGMTKTIFAISTPRTSSFSANEGFFPFSFPDDGEGMRVREQGLLESRENESPVCFIEMQDEAGGVWAEKLKLAKHEIVRHPITQDEAHRYIVGVEDLQNLLGDPDIDQSGSNILGFDTANREIWFMAGRRGLDGGTIPGMENLNNLLEQGLFDPTENRQGDERAPSFKQGGRLTSHEPVRQVGVNMMLYLTENAPRIWISQTREIGKEGFRSFSIRVPESGRAEGSLYDADFGPAVFEFEDTSSMPTDKWYTKLALASAQASINGLFAGEPYPEGNPI